jgi:16S rRNA (adenine1518-N6/adenine1519-N6)-dimethyltransferase
MNNTRQPFRPKRAFGQHFLTDQNIVRKIVSESGVGPGDNVWEVGGGKGILTEALLESGCNLTVFEIDFTLQEYLEQAFGNRINLVSKDVLKANWESMFTDQPVKVVANIPYQITSPLLFRIAKYHSHFDKVVVMIQKEVAQRMVAHPNTKDYGILTLKMQYYFNIEYLFTVPPTVFSPPPKVDSAVIRLTPRINKPEITDLDKFWKLVEIAFQQRRKMLRNNVRNLVTEEQFQQLITTTPIELNRRGESLDEQEFILLFRAIELL